MSSVVSELKKGAVITFATKYLNIILQLGLGAILARLLTPQEYGVVAVVTVFITFFSLLSELGIGPAIIQRKNVSDNEKATLLNLTIVLGIVLGIVFYFFSYYIAIFYDNRVYINIGKLLSILIFLNTLLIVPQSLLRKEQKFKELGIIQIVSVFISGAIAIYLARKGLSYYSIVIQSLVGAIIQNICSFSIVKVKFNFKFDKKIVKEIWQYSLYQFLFNFINYFSRNLDNILIGKYIGDSSLGYYDKAYKLMLYPINILTSTISSILHPVLSKYQDNYEMIFESYMKIVKLLSIVGFPLSVYLYFSSYEIITIMYGHNWEMAIPVFKILSLSVCIQLISSSSGSIFQSTGRTDYLFLSGLLSAILMVSLIVVGVLTGDLEKVSYLLISGFLINFIQAYYLLIKKIFKKSWSEFFINLRSGLIIGLISLLAKLLLLRFIKFELLQNFLLKILISGVFFLLGLYLTGEYKEFKKILNK